MSDEEATELEWLRWFVDQCDFGPGDGDVRWLMQERFEEDTGKRVPDMWRIQ